MSTKNISYATKLVIVDIIKEVFPRCFNQLPLKNIEYPFAVYEIEIFDNHPGNILNLIIDLWDNKKNQLTFQNLADDLVEKLDYISNSDNNKTVHLNGIIKYNRDIPTQEEDLIRIQLQGEYNLYKSY
ncbi:hypothetical protein A2V49_03250 [candidate division WWE3 bacterium RBG_19FT_COMBO_34_6]|jgi:hypothetical protein|uniref:DUF3168 domain-containing protein n=1 Tax=candidate division WWE3 bacterium RBG_19FT_COMBO_34_6 TaxID=1802612 RepID=A0A1F4UKH9_UNCKA|nr:MAG: hypothetical protein A2V49_03250 [candidate division WWE3 bacterium RBG_19FT_COMBO_34_6]